MPLWYLELNQVIWKLVFFNPVSICFFLHIEMKPATSQKSTAMKFAIHRAVVEKSFRDYTSAYNLNDARVKLKVYHTFRVAALSDVITDSLGMTGYDRDLAWLLGMLHDIGSFEQVRRYHTFRGALFINHAELSADILFRDGLIRNFFMNLKCMQECLLHTY